MIGNEYDTSVSETRTSDAQIVERILKNSVEVFENNWSNSLPDTMNRKNKNKSKEEAKDDKKEVEAHEIPMVDQIYVYNESGINKMNQERPWDKDPKYFTKCRINVLAATKMVKHAIQGVNQGRKKGGLPTEIMGLLVGRPDPNTRTLVSSV